MKKKYTKKQITEAIAYWKKQLKMMNEDFDHPQQNEPEWTKQFTHIGNKSLVHCNTSDSIAQEIKRFDKAYPAQHPPQVVEIGALIFKGPSLQNTTDLYTVGFIYDGQYARHVNDVEKDAANRIEEILSDPSMAGYTYEISNAFVKDQPYDYDFWMKIQ